jgi:intein-encoded DNA endonuclease-like protein
MEALFEERFRRGKETYGHGVRVDQEGMNWIQETREELMDAVIYLIADYIRSGREAVGYQPIEKEDDNETIMNIIKNYSAMKEGRHRRHVSSLLRMLDDISAF